MRIGGRAVFNILVLGLLAWALIWFFVSDRFYVYEVEVQGNQRVSTEAIISASEIQGYSVFWINGRQVAAAVAESLPPIHQVKVRYALPNRVILTVQEQGEQVMWLVKGDRYWVDDEGLFHPAQGGDDPRLLVRDVRPGLLSQVSPDAVVAAQQLVQLLPEQQSVEYEPATGLRFTHSLGWVVYLGTEGDMARRVRVLRTIERRLSAEGTRQPSLVDVRFPDNPYYRYPDE